MLLRAIKAQVKARGGGLRLSLVFRAGGSRPIGLLDLGVHAHERDLADRHAVIDRDRQVGDVRELQGEVALKAGIHEPRGAVDQQPEAAEARLALEPADDVIRKLHPLERLAQDELAGMQDERILARDLDQLGQLLHRLAHVDVGVARVVKHAELAVGAHVDARRLNQRLVVRVEDNAPGLNLGANGPVREHHGRPVYLFAPKLKEPRWAPITPARWQTARRQTQIASTAPSAPPASAFRARPIRHAIRPHFTSALPATRTSSTRSTGHRRTSAAGASTCAVPTASGAAVASTPRRSSTRSTRSSTAVPRSCLATSRR